MAKVKKEVYLILNTPIKPYSHSSTFNDIHRNVKQTNVSRWSIQDQNGMAKISISQSCKTILTN